MRALSIFSALLFAMSANAASTKYSDFNGCEVEVEQRNNGQIFYVSKDSKTEVVGLTKDLSSGTFSYCDDSVLQIHSYEGSKGTAVIISCSEHENGNATTRGRVDIEFMDQKLTKISIAGQVKGIFGGWKNDVEIACSNLVRQ